MEINKAHIGEMTPLPVVEITYADKPGRGLRVMTPHKGEVIFEYHSQGMFREKNADVGDLLKKLRALEDESRDYLLDKWLHNYYNPPTN